MSASAWSRAGHMRGNHDCIFETDLTSVLTDIEGSGMKVDSSGLVTDWADRPGQDPRPVFVTSGKRRKIEFGTREELLLLSWCSAAETQGGFEGSAIFKQLECLYPRHSWQAYEGKWRRGGLSQRSAPEMTTDSPFPNLFPASQTYLQQNFRLRPSTMDGPTVDYTETTADTVPDETQDLSDDSDDELTYSDFRVDVIRNVYLRVNVLDEEELCELLGSDWIVAPFVEFVQASLVPLRNEDLDSISRLGTLPRRRGRGPHRWKIRRTIDSTNAPDSRYLHSNPDKSGWTHDDHEIRFMAQIARAAFNSAGHAWSRSRPESVEVLCERSFWLMFWTRWVYRPVNTTSKLAQRVQRQKDRWLGFFWSLCDSPTREAERATRGPAAGRAVTPDPDETGKGRAFNAAVEEGGGGLDAYLPDLEYPPSSPSHIKDVGGTSSLSNASDVTPVYLDSIKSPQPHAIVGVSLSADVSYQQAEPQVLQTASTATTDRTSREPDAEERTSVASASPPPPVTHAPQVINQIDVPEYTPTQSKTRNQQKGVLWLTEDYYLIFKNFRDNLLRRWGVTAEHSSTYILMDSDWAHVSPEELEDSFPWDQPFDESVSRMRYTMSDMTVSLARASVWFGSWPERPRRGADLDVLLVRQPGDVYPAWQASHLCAHGKCIVPTHLVAETATRNMSRMSCETAAKNFRTYGLPIPRHCNKHEPPCWLQDAALTTKEKLAIQFWTFRRARGLPARESPRPRDHPPLYATFEQSLPLTIGTDTYSLISDHLVSHTDEKNQPLEAYRIQCRFCSGV